ncbi:MAG: hypothetical protein V1835_07445 [Candidatus Micrarchaeota archaeon]
MANKIIASAFVLMLASNLLAMTPDDFDGRMDNLVMLNAVLSANQVEITDPSDRPATPTPSPVYPYWKEIAEKIKIEYRSGYEAQQVGMRAKADAHYDQLMKDFDELKPHLSPKLKLEALLELVNAEFGREPMVPTPSGFIVQQKEVGADPTVVVIETPSVQPRRIIPTVSSEQMRGKKNIFYALGDVLWENGLLIGGFMVGMLVLYALYHKDEEESGTG